MDENEVCRVCLQQDGNMINIFDSIQDPQTFISDMITQWCGYQVVRGDLLPETICPTCLEEVCRIPDSKDLICDQETQRHLPNTYKVESNIAQEYQVKNEPVDDDMETSFKGMDSSLFEADVCKTEVMETSFSAAQFVEANYYPDSETDLPPKKSKNKTQKTLATKKTPLKQQNLFHLHDPTLYMPFKCNYCPQTFEDKDSYTLHSGTHGKQYRCSDCPKSFAEAEQLEKHLLGHSEDQSDKHKATPSDPANRVFKCPKCPKTFPYASSCSRHLMSHLETRPHKCPKCPKSYARPYALRAHFTCHSEERPFQCDQCPKAYSKAHHLRDHLITHSEDKPYKCSQCIESYMKKSELKRHIQTHAEEKPHKCDECSKTFSSGEDLEVHIRTHTGEKLFMCTHCLKSFSVRANMYKHRRQCKLEKSICY